MFKIFGKKDKTFVLNRCAILSRIKLMEVPFHSSLIHFHEKTFTVPLKPRRP